MEDKKNNKNQTRAYLCDATPNDWPSSPMFTASRARNDCSTNHYLRFKSLQSRQIRSNNQTLLHERVS